MMNADCTVLVCSCDKYADLLAPFATLWRKYWPDCPFETVLVTETAPDDKLCFNRVVACGKVGNWCGRLVEALEAIATPYVIMLCDDYYLSSPVDTEGILLRLGQAKNYDAANLRLIPNPVPGVRNSSPAEDGLFEYRRECVRCLLRLVEVESSITNHLDINAKDMLLRALQEYKGTIIFVSHDAYFIRAIADRILYLSENPPAFFNGDYDYFQWKLNEAAEPAKVAGAAVKAAPEVAVRTETIDRAEANRIRNRKGKLKTEIDSLMSRIGEIEDKIRETDAQMNMEENYSDVHKISDLANRRKALEEEREELEALWMEKSDELESM